MDIQGNVKKSDHNKNDKPAMYFVGKDRKTYTKEVPKEFIIDNGNEYVSGTYVSKPQEQKFIVKNETKRNLNKILGKIIYLILIIFLFFFMISLWVRAF